MSDKNFHHGTTHVFTDRNTGVITLKASADRTIDPGKVSCVLDSSSPTSVVMNFDRVLHDTHNAFVDGVYYLPFTGYYRIHLSNISYPLIVLTSGNGDGFGTRRELTITTSVDTVEIDQPVLQDGIKPGPNNYASIGPTYSPILLRTENLPYQVNPSFHTFSALIYGIAGDPLTISSQSLLTYLARTTVDSKMYIIGEILS